MTPAQVLANKNLVINGGCRVIKQEIAEDTGIVADAFGDVASVVKTKHTQYWGGGPKAHELERGFAAYVGKQYAFFHNSGTAALQTALFASGVGDGDAVAISSSGFIASLNVIYHLRCRPVFLPTDPKTMVVRQDVSQYVKGLHLKSAIITHFFGNVVDLSSTCEQMEGALIIEDGGQAHGAFYEGRPVGSFGDIGSFACSNKKLVTAGQGGLNVTDDPHLIEMMRVYAHHGKDRHGVETVPGYNFRGGEMEAVLAIHALRDLAKRVNARNKVAKIFHKRFKESGINFAVPFDGVDCSPAWFDIPVILSDAWVGYRDDLIKALIMEGVPAWKYDPLICAPWVRPYMISHGWWDDASETMMRSEKSLWDRTFVIGTQFTADEADVLAQRIVDVLNAQ